MTIEFFAAASPGSETALKEELDELHFRKLRVRRGGVTFTGRVDEGWRACLASRIAQRVYMPLGRFEARDAGMLYNGVRALDWTRCLDPHRTFAISAVVSDADDLGPPAFVALKSKDALVDQLRERHGSRPSVDRNDPDVRILVHVFHTRVTVQLDMAGRPLFQRGYRADTVEAPLRETLAATILRLSGWDRGQPLVDPMCGSGTLPIEAALWAGNMAPGLFRSRFGFERWACHDADAARRLAGLRGDLRRAAHCQKPRILGADADPSALETARANARGARVRIALKTARLADLQCGPGPGLLVANPPYGVRLQTDDAFLRELAGAVCRQHGWRAALLAGDPGIAGAIPLKPVRSLPLKNGDIDCRLLIYDVP